MWLRGFYFGAFHVESCLALSSRVVVFSVVLAIVIHSLGEERELFYVLPMLLFVYFVSAVFVLFLFLFVSGAG